jgi:hypothetical protein
MQIKSLAALSFIAVCSTVAMADQPPQKPDNAELDAALKECSATANGDMSAMDSCMEGKGFKKPDGPPPNGNGGEPPSN